MKLNWLISIQLIMLSFLMTSSGFASTSHYAIQGKIILAIFAHPDDETMVAPLLAKYAREGATVKLAIVTDGQKGGQPPGPIGKELKGIRAAEAQCSTDALSIDAPIMMEFVDGDVAEKVNEVKIAIASLIAKIHPDIIITWGPEGGYGHKDHRMVNAIVTGLFQAGGSEIAKAVYYPGIPQVQVDRFVPSSRFGHMIKAIWGVTDEQYLPYRITVNKADIAVTYKSAACHASQFDAATLIDINSFIDAANQKMYLRKSHRNEPVNSTLFPDHDDRIVK